VPKLNYKNDSVWSSERFEKIIKPKLETILKSKIQILENKKDDLSVMIDIHSGIDGYRFNERKGVQFIASRIQLIKGNHKPYDTFTVRYKRMNSKTEYEKRLEQIKCDWAYPHITIQSYINKKEELLSLGIVYTKILYEYTENNIKDLAIKTNHDLSSSFLIVPFNVFSGTDKFVYWSNSLD
jgi:hypothetical protein